MRVVGVLAFCQAIFFLALFLFLCARAGAATESKSGTQSGVDPLDVHNPKLTRSVWSASGGLDGHEWRRDGHIR